MRIFYIGSTKTGATSKHRADALGRVGHSVTAFDPYQAMDRYIGGRLSSRIHYNTGYRFVQGKVQGLLRSYADAIAAHDVIWVNGGELLGASVVAMLRSFGPRLVLFNNDDPTGGRDGARFNSLVSALPIYDLCVTVRDGTLQDFNRLPVRRAMRTWMGCDEEVHAPPTTEELALSPYPGGIAFIGTWIRGENRDRILSSLIKRGLPISIWGERWSQSPHWRTLKEAWRGTALRDRDYTIALASADACLGFLSKGNRDLYTRRSLEAPYAGCVLIAERTTEHQQMYQDGCEALFWDDAEECAVQCERVLSDISLRNRIRAAAMVRARGLGVGNEAIVASILRELERT